MSHPPQFYFLFALSQSIIYLPLIQIKKVSLCLSQARWEGDGDNHTSKNV